MKMIFAALVVLFLLPCTELFAGNQITAAVQVPLNDTLQLTATDENSGPVAATWSVSAGVGTVDSSSGLFTGSAVGTSTVTADYSGKLSSVELEVVDGFKIGDNTTALQSNVAVYGDKVAYVNNSGQLEIRDLVTGGVTTVSETDVQESWFWKNLAMHEDFVAWVGKDKSINYYNIATGEKANVGFYALREGYISLNNGRIVYSDLSGVHLYDIAAGTSTFIGDGTWAEINGDYVVYHAPGPGHELVVYNLKLNQVTKLVDVEDNGTKMVFLYAFQDGKVALIDFTNHNLMYYDVFQDKLILVPNPVNVPRIYDPLSMSGTKILYGGYDGGTLLGAFMYDIETGIHKQLSAHCWVGSGNIGGNHIVLQDNNNLFLYRK